MMGNSGIPAAPAGEADHCISGGCPSAKGEPPYILCIEDRNKQRIFLERLSETAPAADRFDGAVSPAGGLPPHRKKRTGLTTKSGR